MNQHVSPLGPLMEIPPGLIIPLLILGLAVVVVVAYLAHKENKRRIKWLTDWAASNGYTYAGKHRDVGLISRYSAAFDNVKLGQTSTYYADNIVDGRIDGNSFVLFNNHWQTQSTDSKGRRTTSNHCRTVCVMQLPVNLRGELKVRPENFFDKLAGAVGFDDIDFESDEFSKKFHVKARDKKFAYAVITQDMMAFLLRHPTASVELDGGAMCIALGSGVSKPELWPSYLDIGKGIASRLPEYLKDAAKDRP